MSDLLIKGAVVVVGAETRHCDIAIANGRVVDLGLDLEPNGADVLDAEGCYVLPGLVDLHTHLREPGRTGAEDIASGTRAAAMGGYSAVVAMPNTEPTIDNALIVKAILHSAATQSVCDLSVAASITVGRAGKQLSPMAELSELGVRIFTDDGDGLQSAGLMRRALEYASGLGVTVAQHCEDASLSAGGHMHEGSVSARLGIGGIPAEAEEVMVMRDIALARMTGARLHFLHLSTEASVAMVRSAKAQGLAVTAEATPHHFSLTDEALASFDPKFKVNPPIRPQHHVDAVITGLTDGTIDAIATDHAPHVSHLKQLPLTEAPCGMLGLETALALAHQRLDLDMIGLARLMSSAPAEIAGVADHHGLIAVGRSANLCIFDPQHSWTVVGSELASKADNTPYEGMKMQGKVRHTITGGQVIVREGELTR